MEDIKQRLLFLITVRLALVTLLFAATVLRATEQMASPLRLQPFFLAAYVLSAIYLLLWKCSLKFDLLYYLQFYADLLLISLLVAFSGGIDSLYIPLYLLLIVYGSLMRDRAGAILTVLLSIAACAIIVHLGYWNFLPTDNENISYRQVIYRLLLTALGFVAVALLGIYLSERLQRARTELGATQGSLAALTVLHENIVNSIRSGLITLDLSGRITSLNRAAQEILGHSEEHLKLEKLSFIFPEPVLHRILNSDFLSSSRALRLECWLKTRDARSIFLGMSCSPLLSTVGDTIGYVLSFQDLTEIKQLEEEIQLRDKMAAIGQMTASLAHEIRNPLGSISGSIQLLKSELRLSADQARLLDIALNESARLNKIIENFLVGAAGNQPLCVEPVNLPQLVQETVALFRNNPDFKDHHTIGIQAPPEGVSCIGNADQLRQVVWNLLQNSLRAMPNGGKLSIELCSRSNHALMSFRDEGMGMSAEQQKKLAQPFHSGFKKGVGLGMAIVHQIIRQHKGRIDVQSCPGQGTSIEISLPSSELKPAETHFHAH
ncbi:MAG: PAS domain S-box protein [Acidobacteria bacterium]|nr:PAS domain S-box protein [Acidobacteriota bacterium]